MSQSNNQTELTSANNAMLTQANENLANIVEHPNPSANKHIILNIYDFVEKYVDLHYVDDIVFDEWERLTDKANTIVME